MNPSPESVDFFRTGFIPASVKAPARFRAFRIRLEMHADIIRAGVSQQQWFRLFGSTNNACSHGNMFAHIYLQLIVFICLFFFHVFRFGRDIRSAGFSLFPGFPYFCRTFIDFVLVFRFSGCQKIDGAFEVGQVFV